MSCVSASSPLLVLVPLKYRLPYPYAVSFDACFPISHTSSPLLGSEEKAKSLPSILGPWAQLGFQISPKPNVFTEPLGPAPAVCRTWSCSSDLRLAACLQNCSTRRRACAFSLCLTSSSLGLPTDGESRQSSWNWVDWISVRHILSPFCPIAFYAHLLHSCMFY